jgi:hypothetical protein
VLFFLAFLALTIASVVLIAAKMPILGIAVFSIAIVYLNHELNKTNSGWSDGPRWVLACFRGISSFVTGILVPGILVFALVVFAAMMIGSFIMVAADLPLAGVLLLAAAIFLCNKG